MGHGVGRARGALVAVAVLAAGLAGAVVQAPVAGAAPVAFAVDSTLDAVDVNLGDGVCGTASGACTLRAAVQEANAVNDNLATITLPAGTYQLTLAETGDGAGGSLDIDTTAGGTAIVGTGIGSSVIRPVPSANAFEVHPGAQLELESLSVTNAVNATAVTVDTGALAAIAVEFADSSVTSVADIPSVIDARASTVVLEAVEVVDNHSEGPGAGDWGTIRSTDGTLNVNQSSFERNYTECCGAAILNRSLGDLANATVTDSYFADNTSAGGLGGAIRNHADRPGLTAWLLVTGSEFVDNLADSAGGGAITNSQAAGSAHLGVFLSRFEGNRSNSAEGGAIANLGGDTGITDTTFVGNSVSARGGAIYSSGDLEIAKSTFLANSSGDSGGAVFSTWNVDVANSTFTGNVAEGGSPGGALFNQGLNAEILNSTLAGNSAGTGGGIYSTSFLTGIGNSIVADNVGGDCGGNLPFTAGHNLDSDGTCLPGGGPGDLPGADPMLAPLGDYGGPTQTMPPLPGSPVLDAADPNLCAHPAVLGIDQRGETRGDPCDIGAVEGAVLPGPGPGPGTGGPTVSVVATVGEAVEGGAPGELTFSRSGNPGQALRVLYNLAGSATRGVDFEELGEVRIPAGESSVKVPVRALADAIEDPGEIVVVEVIRGTGYRPANPRRATVRILETDPCADGSHPGFEDVPESSLHHDAILCLATLGYAQGGPGDGDRSHYGPDLDTTRGQLASFAARMLRDLGAEVPQNTPDAFDDDDGSKHEVSINQLVAWGILADDGDELGLDDPVSREEMAAVLNGMIEVLLGERLSSEEDWFSDDDGSDFEADINGLASVGIVVGDFDELFHPTGTVQRDDMASFLIRTLQHLRSSL